MLFSARVRQTCLLLTQVFFSHFSNPSLSGFFLPANMEESDFKELRRWKWTPGIKAAEELDQDVYEKSGHTYHTLNAKGYTFKLKNASASHWISSLPESPAPLVDLGAGFGFRVADAIRSGRDVIAVDCEQRHLERIEQTVRDAQEQLAVETQNDGTILSGQLLQLKLATLPQADLFERNSIAGALLSQVLHFVKPSEPLQIFHDVFRWLQPGALFVVTTMSPAMLEFFLSIGSELVRPRAIDELWQFLQSASDDQIAKECPMYVKISHNSIVRRLGSRLVCFSTHELRALAHIAGFEILALDYIQPTNVAVPFSKTDMATMLIARKPIKIQ